MDTRLKRALLPLGLAITAPLVLLAYRRGVPLPADPHEAARWLRKAASTMGHWTGELGGTVLAATLGMARESPADPLALCTSPAMRDVRDLVDRVARTDATVMLRGETGVGKEVVARAVHQASGRREGPWVKVNCAAIPSELLESELFGHEKGAFTGATAHRRGAFQLAHRGTLFLDEVAELTPELQAKLLHVVDGGPFSRIGGTRPVQTDARLIVATNQDLEAAMQAGRFREDLFYRLNVVEISVPPLRQRREEIQPLVDHFLATFNARYGKAVEPPAPVMQQLLAHDWPGNVRELENAVHRLVLLGELRLAAPRDTPLAAVAEAANGAPAPFTPPASLKQIAQEAAREAERIAIETVLERVRWNRARAAEVLNVSYRTLLYKLASLKLARAANGTLRDDGST
jgi:transcriptional regulator with PAS, ATPase and Fis domain